MQAGEADSWLFVGRENALYSRSLKHSRAALTHAAGMSGTKAQRDLQFGAHRHSLR